MAKQKYAFGRKIEFDSLDELMEDMKKTGICVCLGENTQVGLFEWQKCANKFGRSEFEEALLKNIKEIMEATLYDVLKVKREEKDHYLQHETNSDGRPIIDIYVEFVGQAFADVCRDPRYYRRYFDSGTGL